jgi:hypothetical protein
MSFYQSEVIVEDTARRIMATLIFGVILVTGIAGIVWAVPDLYAKLYSNPKEMQVVLQDQNYDLAMNDIRELMANKQGFLTEGGQGPESIITVEGEEDIQAYLSVEKVGSANIPFLRYVNDDSIIGSPTQLPENLKETW